MEFRLSDPQLMERLQRVQQTFNSDESGIRTSTSIFVLVLIVVNVSVIVASAWYVLSSDANLFPGRMHNQIQVDKEDLDTISEELDTGGLYAMYSLARFRCDGPASRAKSHAMTLERRGGSNFNNSFATFATGRQDELGCYSHLLAFKWFLDGETIKVHTSPSGYGELQVIKIAEYSATKKG